MPIDTHEVNIIQVSERKKWQRRSPLKTLRFVSVGGTLLKPTDRWAAGSIASAVFFSSAYRSQQHTKDADREILRFLNTKESKWVETCVHPFKVHVVLLRAAFVSNKRAPFRRTTKATREFLFWFFCQSRSQTADAHLMWVEKNAIVVQCAKNILFSAFDKINGKKKFQPDWKYVYAWSKVIL